MLVILQEEDCEQSFAPLSTKTTTTPTSSVLRHARRAAPPPRLQLGGQYEEQPHERGRHGFRPAVAGSPIIRAAVGVSGDPQEGLAAPVIRSIRPPDDDDANAGGGVHQRPGRWGVERRHDDATAAQYLMAPHPRSSLVERRRLPAAVRQDRGYDPVNGVDVAPARDQRPLAGPRFLGDGAPRVHLP